MMTKGFFNAEPRGVALPGKSPKHFKLNHYPLPLLQPFDLHFFPNPRYHVGLKISRHPAFSGGPSAEVTYGT
jgi:hypothetical protein